MRSMELNFPAVVQVTQKIREMTCVYAVQAEIEAVITARRRGNGISPRQLVSIVRRLHGNKLAWLKIETRQLFHLEFKMLRALGKQARMHKPGSVKLTFHL